MVDSMKALDPKRPIREADIPRLRCRARFWGQSGQKSGHQIATKQIRQNPGNFGQSRLKAEHLIHEIATGCGKSSLVRFREMWKTAIMNGSR
jgi:hypothetical protein